MAPHMSPKPGCVRPPVPIEKRVAIARYKLASCCKYRVVGNKFGVHKSSVKNCVYTFCGNLVKYHMKTFIQLPSAQQAAAIAARFEAKCHIPQIFGVIDGTHITITAPKKGSRNSVSRKMWTSYNILAVVDDRALFRCVTCNVPESAHDSSVLKVSCLYGRSEDVLSRGKRTFRGLPIPFMLLGDPAYPRLPWIFRGYSGTLTAEQEYFNVYHISGRNIVEHAFGRLKGRWRITLKRADINYKFMRTVIAVACILYNFCEERHEIVADQWISYQVIRTLPIFVFKAGTAFSPLYWTFLPNLYAAELS
ncbi:hypothetical protein HPB49_006806 [Dermacentor silvarum]|uniref:Uncharacterized protein n=1 Tax=Dermacentor silvarum TaxID=543639 RepID=A0ACB8CQ96_DERSI|nr:hypothetical protein HPB49_006806 [Dermacentor silvarum]